jgi:hypothetical protein
MADPTASAPASAPAEGQEAQKSAVAAPEGPNTGDIKDNRPQAAEKDDGSVRLSREEYAAIEKWVQERLAREERAKTDRFALLGDDEEEIDRLAVERLEKKLAAKAQRDAEDKDPTAKRLRELEEYKAKAEKKAEEFERERYEMTVRQTEANVGALLDQAVSKLPESLQGSREVKLAMLDEIEGALDSVNRGGKDLTMEELVERAKGRSRSIGEAWLGSLTDEEVIALLPPKLKARFEDALEAPPKIPSGTSAKPRQTEARDADPRRRFDPLADAFGDAQTEMVRRLEKAQGKIHW